VRSGLKVLFLVSRYAPHAIGGSERVAETLAKTLIAAGNDVVVLTTLVNDDPEERLVDGVRVRAIPLRNVYDFGRPAVGILKPLWHLIDSSNYLMKAAVARVIREERPDVMHSHLVTGFSPTAWDVAYDAGVPIVHTLHDHYVICARSSMAIGGHACHRQHLDCAILSRPRIRASRRVDAVVGVSEYILRRHREFGAFETHETSVIPNPCHLVDTRANRPAETGHTPGQVRFGFMGRIESNKGIDLLLSASRALPATGWSMTIAGSGDPAFTSRLRAEYENAAVSFVGRVDPATFLSRIDALVVPSTFPETFGMSAAEALAMGVPVVASTIGALPELIKEGHNGFLFDPAVPGALENRLRQIVENPATISSMTDACRASVSAFSAASVAGRYSDLYRHVTRGRRTSP
jgi:glycosyltransferase involved in cell wall biosynthesis